ncbi:hypothetical protein LC608_18850 [Nostoc sp. XA010]|uniref:hypothetical protein n=1 Tax=Nostoc sp. XA010 TaxID=2780407 RepID=UPI001E3774F2|nr:hypothetical protein [Nostoc sp. XA010]MCC5658999.1 hypothetical protein [Nostoc sp. XA010]
MKVGLTHELRNNVDASLRDATRTACRRLPQRHREASALGGFPDLKQLARHGEIRV